MNRQFAFIAEHNSEISSLLNILLLTSRCVSLVHFATEAATYLLERELCSVWWLKLRYIMSQYCWAIILKAKNVNLRQEWAENFRCCCRFLGCGNERAVLLSIRLTKKSQRCKKIKLINFDRHAIICDSESGNKINQKLRWNTHHKLKQWPLPFIVRLTAGRHQIIWIQEHQHYNRYQSALVCSDVVVQVARERVGFRPLAVILIHVSSATFAGHSFSSVSYLQHQ